MEEKVKKELVVLRDECRNWEKFYADRVEETEDGEISAKYTGMSIENGRIAKKIDNMLRRLYGDNY